VFGTILVLVAATACSKTATPAATTAAGGSTPAATEPAQADAVKPVPAQLPDVVATVNGESITKAEFESAVKNIEASNGGQPVPAPQRDQVYRGVLEQLVGYKLLLQEVNTRKLVVPEADVEARIGEIKKQFPSEQVFTQMLQSRQLTLDKLRSDAKADLAVNRLLENAIADKIGVSAEQVTKFHKDNPDRFKQPDSVRASHILLPFPENADAAAKAKVKTQAEQVLKDVKAGRDFAALAKQHSKDPGSAVNGGDLGFFQRGQMVGPFNDAAFSLGVGQTSDLVETQFGYHIIRVTEKQAAKDIPLDEVRAEVVRYLEGVNREKETKAFVDGLKAKGKVTVAI
jgi:peptidyl-prolyl cis-trans isomerase C